MRRAALLLLFLVPLALADPGGSDAPDRWEDARPIPLQDLTGEIAAGDGGDWYRISIPPATGVHAFVSIGSRSVGRIELRDDDGNLIEGRGPDNAANFSYATVSGGRTDAVRLGLEIDLVVGGASREYTVTLRSIDLPDVVVSDVSLAPHSDRLDLWHEHVTVHARNEGRAAGGGHLHVFAHTPIGDKWRLLASSGLVLAPGEDRLVELDLDTTGIIGEYQIVAVAQIDDDFDFASNVRSAAASVGADVDGVGADVIPFDRGCGLVGPTSFCWPPAAP